MSKPKPPAALETVTIKVELPRYETDNEWVVEMTGRSQYQRPSLWVDRVTWHRAEVDHGLQVCDQVNWALHCILQDRPTSRFWLDRSFRGLPVGVQGVLFD